MSRWQRRAASALAAAALLLAIDTAAWWWLSGQVIAGFTRWQAAQQAAGVQVVAGPPVRAGWPLQAAAVLDGLTVRDSSPGGGTVWHTGRLRLAYVPWRPRVFTATPTGPQQVDVGDAGTFTLTAATATASIPLDPASAAVATTVSVLGVEVRWTRRSMSSSVPSGSVAAERVALRWTAQEGSLALDRLALPRTPSGTALLGGVVDTLAMQARFTPPLAPTGDLPARMAAWRAVGGQFQLTQADLRWGPLAVQATATLAVNPGQPLLGSGALRVQGYTEALDSLERSGIISAGRAQAAGALLDLLAQRSPRRSAGSGQAPQTEPPREVDLPLTLQNGLLAAGGFPLLRVPDFMLH